MLMCLFVFLGQTLDECEFLHGSLFSKEQIVSCFSRDFS